MANQKTNNLMMKQDEIQDQERPPSSSSSKNAKKCKEIPGLVLNANGEEEYKVERIITKKLIDGVVNYRIKWVGYNSKCNTWEPIQNLRNCLEMLTDFEIEYQNRNGAVERGRGRPVKVSPPVKPEHYTFVNAEDEIPKVKRKTAEDTYDYKAVVNEYLDRKYLGPVLRRVWKESEIPLCILGSKIMNGDLIYLIRIKGKDEVEALVLEYPYEGLTVNNCVKVLSQTFNWYFPQMVLEYFLKNGSKFVEEGIVTNGDLVTKAARSDLLQVSPFDGVDSNEMKLFNDISDVLHPTQTVVAGDFTSTCSKQSQGSCTEEVGREMTSSYLNDFILMEHEFTYESDLFGLFPDTSFRDSEDFTEKFINYFNRIEKSTTGVSKVFDTVNSIVEDVDIRNGENTVMEISNMEQENDATMENLTVLEDEDSDLETILDENYDLNAEGDEKFMNSLGSEDENDLLDIMIKML